MRRSWLERTLTRRVILHLKSDQSIQGLLVGVFSDGVALRKAELLRPEGAAPTSFAGEIWVPREEILLTQHADA